MISYVDVKIRVKHLEYKWVALTNTTLGMLIATINASILLIALPDIFRGIGIDPLAPGNTSYLLWLILGFMVVMAVLLVSLGRLGDIYGRVKMFNLGFAVFTVFSILLSVTWMHGSAGAIWLILMRVGQGIGASLLFANSNAILTDAFPQSQRGFALGVNSILAIAGSFVGLVLGGVLAPISWRLIFLVSVPIGVVATFWAYHSLRELGARRAARIDWWGNATFALGLVGVMVGITYGIQPYGGHDMGWTSPFVLSVLSIGVFFTLMIVGLASGLPHTMQQGLVAHGVPPADATTVSHLPPVATLFASFLGYNPMATLLGPKVRGSLPPGQASELTGRSFFPHLISGPFHTALVYAFVFAIACCLVAAVASLLRGGKYHHVEVPAEVAAAEAA